MGYLAHIGHWLTSWLTGWLADWLGEVHDHRLDFRKVPKGTWSGYISHLIESQSPKTQTPFTPDRYALYTDKAWTTYPDYNPE